MKNPERDIEDKLKNFVREELSKSGGAHRFDHILRVHKIAMHIGEQEGANMRVLSAAAILHDVGRPREKEEGISHSILSGTMSKGILAELGYQQYEIASIIDAIRTHRFSEGLEPNSLEGQILSDADKLDAMGAVGVFRGVAQAMKDKRGMEGFLKHADEKLLKLHGLLYTKIAREMGEQRHNLLEAFVFQLRCEMDA
jgi:uncharacterized protein